MYKLFLKNIPNWGLSDTIIRFLMKEKPVASLSHFHSPLYKVDPLNLSNPCHGKVTNPFGCMG